MQFGNKHVLYLFSGIFVALLIFVFVVLSIRSKGKIPSSDVVHYAQSYLPGENKEKVGRRLDCSGYVRDVYAHFGINMASSARDQYHQIHPIKKKDEPDEGNLVFFGKNKRRISHVGISLGGNKFIHSPGIDRDVKIDSLNSDYWKPRFICGGKIKRVD